MEALTPIERALALLGPLEGRIMKAIWSGEVPEPFVVRTMQATTPELAYTTIMTTLNRLADKGLLSVRPAAGRRAHEYRLGLTPEEFVTRAGRQQVRQLIASYGEAAITAFSDYLEELSPDERERMGRLAGRE